MLTLVGANSLTVVGASSLTLSVLVVQGVRMSAGRVANGLIWSVIAAVATLLAVLGIVGAHALGSVTGIVAVVIFSTLCAALSAVVVGLPAHLLFHRRGINGPISYLLVGVLAAIAPFLTAEAGELLEGRRFDWREFGAWSRLAIPCGVVGAATFWAVAVRSRNWKSQTVQRSASSYR